jgi:hypothetical protein
LIHVKATPYAVAVAVAVAACDDGSTVDDVRARVPGFEPVLVIVRVSVAGEVTRAIDSGTPLAGAGATMPPPRSAPAAVAGRTDAPGTRRARRPAAVRLPRPAARRA